MGKLTDCIRGLTRGERILWGISFGIVLLSFLLLPERDGLTLTASLIGVTALIFVAKGYVLGQILTVVFALFYGVISFRLRYYGEMITYLCMSSPMAILAVISWCRNPFRDTESVRIHRVSGKRWLFLTVSSVFVTVFFWFVLEKLGCASLFVSTLSVTSSYFASVLTCWRSPYYALAYAANDVVLIVLWILAAAADMSQAPMIACFVLFLVNDLYGFGNWRRMQKEQQRLESTL